MSRFKNGKNKYDNYACTFKFDSDIEDYIKNITVVTFVESMKSGEIQGITRNDYINMLVRKDMLETFKENNVSTWEEYREKFKIKGNTNEE